MPEWTNASPIYDIHKTYLENLEEGPFFDSIIPQRDMADKREWIDFLGIPLASPLGIPAGPLLDSKWIKLAANLGFDLLTYKTIRSHEHPSHPLPNILPVQTHGQLIPGNLPESVTPSKNFIDPTNDTIGITNSFGNPSKSQQYLRRDITKANAALREGQAMIVSIFGTSHDGVDIIDDFSQTARFAKDCGAKLIEANYSCPNVAANEGTLFSSPELIYKFSSQIVKAIKDTPLIIKIGLLPDSTIMRDALISAAKAGVRAICGINTISMKVIDENGNPSLGKERATCGICGNPIRDAALHFTRQARKIIDQEKLDMKLMATGGVTLPEHFHLFLNAGADIVMTATGMMWDPYLAMKYHNLKKKHSFNTKEKAHV